MLIQKKKFYKYDKIYFCYDPIEGKESNKGVAIVDV